MICKVSVSIAGTRPDHEMSVTCQLTSDGEAAVVPSPGQLQGLQDACLALAGVEAGFTVDRSVSRPPQCAKGRPTLCQFARMYREATRVNFFDLEQLQGLAHRLYQKPLDEPSMLEVGGMISTLRAAAKGTVNLKRILAEPTFARNGHAGQHLA